MSTRKYIVMSTYNMNTDKDNYLFFHTDPEAVLRKIQTDSGLIILDHVASQKYTLKTEAVNLKMPV